MRLITLALALLLCVTVPFASLAAAKDGGYTVIYDGGSLPDLKTGAKLRLYIESSGIRLMDEKGKALIATVAPSSITQISYAMSKSKKHFVGLTWATGDTKGGFAMECDKNDYRGVIAGLEGVTGQKAVNSDAMTVKN